MSSGPEYASDATTLVQLLAGYEEEGYTTQMAAREGGAIICFVCRTESPASEFRLSHLRRTEGASDPADMTAVAALECPSCGAKGTVVLKYGPAAPIEDAEALRLLDDQRDSSGQDATAFGGEDAAGPVPGGD